MRFSGANRVVWWVAYPLAGVVAVGLGVLGYLHRPVDHGPLDPRPVVLPATLAGETPADQQLLPSDGELMKETFGRYPYGSTTYGSFTRAQGQRLVAYSLVVGRGRFENIGDIEIARPPFTRYGTVTCTHTTERAGKTYTIESVTNCYRIEDRLTVSVVGMGPHSSEESVAAAVEEAWAAQQ